jgi:hypothetical protein
MAKRSKFQAELLLRSRPPSAFDVLREASTRLQGLQTFPPGILQVVGNVIAEVLAEADQVKAIREEEAKAQPLAVEDAK